MKLTEEQLEAARIELERRAKEKNKPLRRKPNVTRDNLSNFITQEYTETGEYWWALHELNEDHFDFMSDELKKAVDKELNSIVQNINDNYLEVIDSAGELIELEYIDA